MSATDNTERAMWLKMSRVKSLMKQSSNHVSMTSDAVVAMAAIAQYVALRWLTDGKNLVQSEDKRFLTSDVLARAKESDEAIASVFPYRRFELLGQGVRPFYTDAVKAQRNVNKAKREARAEKRAEEERQEEERRGKKKNNKTGKRKAADEEEEETQAEAPKANGSSKKATKSSKKK